MYLLAAMMKNKTIMQAFPEGMIDENNYASNQQYANFCEEILKRLKLKKFEKGEFVCHKGDEGHEMYIIIQGDVGVFLDCTIEDEVFKKRRELNHLAEQILENPDLELNEEIIRQRVHFE